MKQNRNLILILIPVSAALIYFILTRSNSTIKPKLRDFSVADTGNVDKIFIADKLNHTAELTRSSSGVWMVNGKYLARQDAIINLLATLNKLAVKAPVANAMEQNVLKDLAGPLQKKVEVYAKGQLIKTIYVGGETLDKQGTFMLLENSSVPFEVHIPGHHGFLQTRFIADENLWRDQAVFAAQEKDIKSLTVRYNEHTENSFTITKSEQGNLSVKESLSAGEADTLKLHQYLAQYRRIVYEYIISESFQKSKKDSILRSKPFVEITLIERSGKSTNFKGYYRELNESDQEVLKESKLTYDPERLYGLINDKEFVLAQFFQFDRILFTGRDFLK